LLSCLLFDDETTRAEPIKSYRFTHIKEIWDLFITNYILYYESGYNVTIHEHILSFDVISADSLYSSHKLGKRGLNFVTTIPKLSMINAIP